MKLLKYIFLIVIFLSCEKSEDTSNNTIETEEENLWIVNDSIEFNSLIDHLLVDSLTNTLYCDGMTHIESNSSFVKIDNEAWCQVGSSIGHSFFGMELYKTRFYVAGANLSYENMSLYDLLYWDGNSWNIGIDPGGGWGRSLEVHDDELYFGGSGFHKLNDTIWSTLSGDLKDTPFELYSYKDQLYGVLRDYYYSMVKWDFAMNLWITISEETLNMIHNILVVDDEIYIGSRFSVDNKNYTINGIAKYNGTEWQDITYNFTPDSLHIQSGEVFGLEHFNGEIYAAITFSSKVLNDEGQIETRTKHVVVKLENNNWEQVGFDFNFPVQCFEVYNNELYIGGDFTNSLAKLKTE